MCFSSAWVGNWFCTQSSYNQSNILWHHSTTMQRNIWPANSSLCYTGSVYVGHMGRCFVFSMAEKNFTWHLMSGCPATHKSWRFRLVKRSLWVSLNGWDKTCVRERMCCPETVAGIISTENWIQYKPVCGQQHGLLCVTIKKHADEFICRMEYIWAIYSLVQQFIREFLS